MCGITGFFHKRVAPAEAAKVIESMTNAIISRGPDSNGRWINTEKGLALGHRRLAIQDITLAGHQPMTSASGRFVIVFNGEIYNHYDLRQELEQLSSICWNGYSDTEVLLAGFECWGIEGTIKRVKGMFAFAVYDYKHNRVTLGRDRLGEKPLYYGWQGDSFVFASELKAIIQHPEFQRAIDRTSLTQYLRYGYVPGARSIYQGINKLKAGTLLELSLDSGQSNETCYWSVLG